MQPIVLDSGHGRGRSLVDAAANRDRAGRALSVARQPLDPQHERISQALRCAPAPVESCCEQLFGVQRIALAAREQPLDELGARRVTEDVGQRFGQLGPIEPSEVDAASALEAIKLRQQRS